MTDTYIIEVNSQAAGIVVRERQGFTFHAATSQFAPMEGQLFRNAREAERAANVFATLGKGQAKQQIRVPGPPRARHQKQADAGYDVRRLPTSGMMARN